MINIMINGLPGKMASEVAQAALEDGNFKLYPFSLTGPEIEEASVLIRGYGCQISLIKPYQRGRFVAIYPDPGDILAVDFTHPDAINENVRFYCEFNIPFVAGTTGGDRDRMITDVIESGNVAVIAPNMAAQVVAFQAMMEYAAENFPGVFEGFNPFISESHQSGKADTSGTAKAVAKQLGLMGVPFDFGNPNHFEMIRNPARQMVMGVPYQYLSGHGWHRYSLGSDDGTMFFQFTHNVNGRKPYALGTLKALRFLDKKVKAGEKGRVYSMIDVLKG